MNPKLAALLVLFMLTLHALLNRFGSHKNVRFILLIVVGTFCIGTVEFTLNVYNIASQTPTYIEHPLDLHCWNTDPLYLQLPMVLQMFVGDAFTVSVW